MTLTKCCVSSAVSAETSHDEMRQKYKVMSSRYQEQDRYFDVTSRRFYSRTNGAVNEPQTQKAQLFSDINKCVVIESSCFFIFLNRIGQKRL